MHSALWQRRRLGQRGRSLGLGPGTGALPRTVSTRPRTQHSSLPLVNRGTLGLQLQRLHTGWLSFIKTGHLKLIDERARVRPFEGPLRVGTTGYIK